MATASLPSGRVSSRVLYLKELDEKGWIIYSNWGSKEGKGAQVFGVDVDVDNDGDGGIVQEKGEGKGNKWGALTFFWPTVERQVRIEGLLERVSREESEAYWRTRERGSQIGGWASWQSKVLWSSQQQQQQHREDNGNTTTNTTGTTEEEEDGRTILDQRVKEMENKFANIEQIPLPPFWGGVRLVPESVEFWQGRKSRLHDRFRYVRLSSEVESGVSSSRSSVTGDGDDENEGVSQVQWRIERLSP